MARALTVHDIQRVQLQLWSELHESERIRNAYGLTMQDGIVKVHSKERITWFSEETKNLLRRFYRKHQGPVASPGSLPVTA